jgi:hypothetical protein
MASKIKVDQIEGSTADTITIPTGQTFTVTDGIPVASGGTGLASFTAGDILYATGATTLAKLTKGTAEQVLAMNSGATAPDWGSVDLTALPTITVAKGGTGQAGGFTEGDILYATGATTLAKLAKGTAAQQIAMNAGATAPEWVTPSAGGAWNFISNTTISNDSTILIEGLDSTYKLYKFVFVSVNGDTTNNHWYCRVKSGGSIKSGSSDYKWCSGSPYSLSAYEWNNGGTDSFMRFNSNGNHVDTDRTQNFIIYCFNPANASSYCYIMVNGVCINNDSHLYFHQNAGVYWNNNGSPAAVTGLQFSQSTGSYADGNIYLYGLATS